MEGVYIRVNLENIISINLMFWAGYFAVVLISQLVKSSGVKRPQLKIVA